MCHPLLLVTEQAAPRLLPLCRMTLKAVYEPPAAVQKGAHVKSMEEYRELYDRSLNDPEVSGDGWQRRGFAGLGLQWTPPPAADEEQRRLPNPARLVPTSFPSAGLLGRAG